MPRAFSPILSCATSGRLPQGLPPASKNGSFWNSTTDVASPCASLRPAIQSSFPPSRASTAANATCCTGCGEASPCCKRLASLTLEARERLAARQSARHPGQSHRRKEKRYHEGNPHWLRLQAFNAHPAHRGLATAIAVAALCRLCRVVERATRCPCHLPAAYGRPRHAHVPGPHHCRR